MPQTQEKLSQQPPAQVGTEADFGLVTQGGETRRQTRTQLRTAILSAWQTFIRTFLASTTTADARVAIGALGSGENAASSTKLNTARTIAVTGDGSWSVSFDGSSNVTGALALGATGVAGGTYGSVTVDAKGRVTAASTVTPVANGGTARTTLALYLADLVGAGAYSKTSILGTVSQTAGVPTGAVIETGGTLSGTGVYTKYADGTMIVIKSLAIATGSTTAKGSIFGSAATSAGNFPVAFAAVPVVNATGSDSNGGGWAALDAFPSTTAWGQYSTRNHVSSGTSGAITLTAVGRWF